MRSMAIRRPLASFLKLSGLRSLISVRELGSYQVPNDMRAGDFGRLHAQEASLLHQAFILSQRRFSAFDYALGDNQAEPIIDAGNSLDSEVIPKDLVLRVVAANVLRGGSWTQDQCAFITTSSNEIVGRVHDVAEIGGYRRILLSVAGKFENARRAVGLFDEMLGASADIPGRARFDDNGGL